MNHFRLLLMSALLPAVTALTACGMKTETSVLNTSAPVATVNGTVISQDFYNSYVKGLSGRAASDLTPEQRNQALDNLIRAELMAQQAQKDGLDKNIDTATLIELARLNILQQAVTDKNVKHATEQEVHAEWEKAREQFPKLEYHAKHIVVATEDFAHQIITRLDKGEKFDDVAKAESMDQGSKNQGGDLGWFTLNGIDQNFGDAVSNLRPGGYTKTPAHVADSWQVIQLVETRDYSPPTFERVRGRIEQIVASRKVKAYTDELMRTAKIDKKLDDKGSASSSPSGSTSATPAKAEDKSSDKQS